MNQESYREKSRHGSALFPFECYIQDSGQSVLVKDHHWHDEMEWIFLQQGKIKIEIDFVEYAVAGRALICIPRGALHKISTIGPCLYYAFVFQFQMLQSVTYDHCEISLMVPLSSGEIQLQKVIDCEDAEEYDLCSSDTWQTSAVSLVVLLVIFAVLFNVVLFTGSLLSETV